MTDERTLQWLSRNWLGLVFSVALLIVAISIFYYFVLFLPEEHRLRQATEEKHRKEEQAQKKEKLELLNYCLAHADIQLVEEWTKKCDSLKRDIDCSLPRELADDIEALWKNEKEICFKKYPQQ